MRTTGLRLPKSKLVLSNRANKKGEHCVYLRFFVDGRYIRKTTDIWIEKKNWDEIREEIIDSYPNSTRLNNKLKLMKDEIMASILELNDNISHENVTQIISGKVAENLQDSIDFIEYAHTVNDSYYNTQKYGYTSWYNKKRYILAFETYIVKYRKESRPKLHGMTPQLFQDYVAYRFDFKGNRNKEGINKTLVPLYVALEHAEKNGIADAKYVHSIVDNYLVVKETKYSGDNPDDENVKYLTPEQMRKLHKSCKKLSKQISKDVMDIFFFSFYACGLRLSDIITLEWKHIDFEKKKIKKIQVKTKKAPQVDIPLSDAAIEILMKWKARDLNPRFVFNRLDPLFDIGDEKKLFMARNAKDKGINRILRVIGHNFKLPIPLTMHVARHSFAVMSINAGMNIYMLSKLLGHSTIVATEKTYAKFLKEKVDKEVESILNFKM